MHRPTLLLLPVAALLAAAAPLQRSAEPPAGWYVGSETPDRYALEIDPQVAHGGRASGQLMQRAASSDSVFGGVNQAVRAVDYRGQRVRLTGYVRAQDAAWAMSWLRVEGIKDDALVAFALSNTSDRPITGTVDWQRFEHVVDVPPAAEALVFGVLTRGGGRIWIDDVTLEVVAPTGSTTSRLSEPSAIQESPEQVREIRARWTTLPASIVNGDFERGAGQ
jgi:hypothetical protein